MAAVYERIEYEQLQDSVLGQSIGNNCKIVLTLVVSLHFNTHRSCLFRSWFHYCFCHK